MKVHRFKVHSKTD